MGVLATALIRQGQYEQAESQVVTFFGSDEMDRQDEPVPSEQACQLLADIYDDCGLIDRAAAWQARSEAADDLR